MPPRGRCPTQQLMESFKLNLYQDEIYVFTPKGDLQILPSGSTPIDFAYEIHSKVGDHCIAAKVNGRIVPLDTQLKSGDQVEILTSKNQTPNPDWEQSVVTHKAKAHIRRWIKDEQRKAMDEGKEQWERRAEEGEGQRSTMTTSSGSSGRRRWRTRRRSTSGIHEGKIDPDEVIALYQEEQKHPQPVGAWKSRGSTASSTGSSPPPGVARRGSCWMARMTTSCTTMRSAVSRIPGDEVVGFVTTGEGIKIHRRSCHNVQVDDQQRTATGSWMCSGPAIMACCSWPACVCRATTGPRC